MKQKKSFLSISLTFILTFMMLLNGNTVQAAEKQDSIPRVNYVNEPILEYIAGDTVNFNLYSPNYGGRVQYRVVLWDNNKKEARDLWTSGDRYYSNWIPYGNNSFNLHWRIDEPGSYRITVYVKRAGIQNNSAALKGLNCDSFMESQAFIVNAKAAALDKDGQTYGSIDKNKIEAYKKDINITAENVTLNNASVEGNLTVTGNNAVIKNVNISGKLVIDPGKDGSCTLDNVTAKNIQVLSGGQNSIHIIDSNIETMDVNSGSPIRVEVDGDTEIVSTSASGYVIFDRKNGTYGTITVTKADNGQSVVEFRGDIKDKIVVETAATIKTGQDSSIANIVINTQNNTDIVRLDGQFGKVEISNDVKQGEGSNAKLEVAANTKIENIVADNDAVIELDKTSSITNVEKKGNEVIIIGQENTGSNTPPTNSSGGSSGSSDDYIPPTVAVSAINVTPITMTLILGGSTGTITATISPSNATNKNVTWSSSNMSVATVANGVVTSVAAGTTTITAAASADSTKTAICTVTILTQDEANAISAVETAEVTPTQGNINIAQGLVTALSDGTLKVNLQGRIDVVQNIVTTALANAKSAADIELAKVAGAQSAYTAAGGLNTDIVYTDVTAAETAVTGAKAANVTADIISTTAALTTKLGTLTSATAALTEALANAKSEADKELGKVAGAQSAYITAGGSDSDTVYIEVTAAETAVTNAKISNITANILTTTATLTAKLGSLNTATTALIKALADAKSAADIELGKVAGAQSAYITAGGSVKDTVYTDVTEAETKVNNAKTSNITANILLTKEELKTKLDALNTETKALIDAATALADAKSEADKELGKVAGAQSAYITAGGSDSDTVYIEVTAAETAVTNAKISNITANILTTTTTLTAKLGSLNTATTALIKALADAKSEADKELGKVAGAQSAYITAGGSNKDAVYTEVTTAETAVINAKTSNITASILSTTAALTTKLDALNTETKALIDAATALANAKSEADKELAKVAGAQSAYIAAGGLNADTAYTDVTAAATAVTNAKTSNITASIISTTAELTTKLGALNTETKALIDAATALADAKSKADIELGKVAGAQSAYITAGGSDSDAVYTDVTAAETDVTNAKISNITANILSTKATLTAKLGSLNTATTALIEALADAKSKADIELGKVAGAQSAYITAGGSNKDAVYTEVTTAETAVTNAKTSNITANILSTKEELKTKLDALNAATTVLTEALANAKSAADVELGKVEGAKSAYTAAGGLNTDTVYTEVTTAATAVTNAKTSNITADILSTIAELITKLGALNIETDILEIPIEAAKITTASLGYIAVGDLQTVLQKAQALVSAGYTVTVNAADGIKISLAGVATEAGPGKICFTVAYNAAPANTAYTAELDINVGIMSKTLLNFNYGTIPPTQAKLISKPIDNIDSNTDFSGVNAKHFTISDGKNTVPVDLYWNIAYDSSFPTTAAERVGSGFDTAIQMHFSPDIMSRTLWAACWDKSTIEIGTYVTGGDAVIKLGGSDWDYFFDTDTAYSSWGSNRSFTVSDGTKTVCITLTQNYFNMDGLVTKINTCLNEAGLNAVAEKASESQFRIQIKTGDSTITTSGIHKTEFFN